MAFYTQEELSSVWQRLNDRTEHDEDDALDVSTLISSRNFSALWARIIANEETEQTLRFTASVGGVEPYQDSDSNSDSATGDYTRRRLNQAPQWGTWERQ